jgi:hypothetical protein
MTEEISRLEQVFQMLIPKVPEMPRLLATLRQHTMNDDTWNENDFKEVLMVSYVHSSRTNGFLTRSQKVAEVTPNLQRLRINLPFQVVGQQSRTATLLLATTMAVLRHHRSEEHKPLDTLVIDHSSDTTLLDICNNHLDLSNMIEIFSGLKHLVWSMKRQESSPSRKIFFGQHLWFLIRKAVKLETLCLIGWNVKRNHQTRTHHHGVDYNNWTMRSMPFHPMTGVSTSIRPLKCLELKRVDIDPNDLVRLVQEFAGTLKELYLNEVYLKVNGTQEPAYNSLWIGNPNIYRPEESRWVAHDLWGMEGLDLTILRATGLGYDDYLPPSAGTLNIDLEDKFDLRDPTGQERLFDERFVQAIMNGPEPLIDTSNAYLAAETLGALAQTTTNATFGNTRPSSIRLCANLTPEQQYEKMMEYDCELYQKKTRNPTSKYKTSIDGNFVNHNGQALQELQNIITVADRGMMLLQAEIDRARNRMENFDGVDPAINAAAARS